MYLCEKKVARTLDKGFNKKMKLEKRIIFQYFLVSY